jgi:hypothetical protein
LTQCVFVTGGKGLAGKNTPDAVVPKGFTLGVIKCSKQATTEIRIDFCHVGDLGLLLTYRLFCMGSIRLRNALVGRL